MQSDNRVIFRGLITCCFEFWKLKIKRQPGKIGQRPGPGAKWLIWATILLKIGDVNPAGGRGFTGLCLIRVKNPIDSHLLNLHFRPSGPVAHVPSSLTGVIYNDTSKFVSLSI